MPDAPALARNLRPHVTRAVEAATGPVIVGIDGRSAAGKSTLAYELAVAMAEVLTATLVIDGDSFYGGGSAATWDRRSADEAVEAAMDWRREREVLTRLRAGEPALWYPFDWESARWDADPPPVCAEPFVIESVPELVVLEGVYSCRPELRDLLDLRVLLAVPDDVRRARLVRREGEDFRAAWEARWSAAEDHYFGTIMPPDAFDVVLAVPA